MFMNKIIMPLFKNKLILGNKFKRLMKIKFNSIDNKNYRY